MKIVMTLMVRDEADVIRAMLEHHRQQGVDQIIVTDNASTDGTYEILEEYAATGFVDLSVDTRHNKQQAEVVTAMARRAATEFAADWVINADADEFWVSQTSASTLRDEIEQFLPEEQAVRVPVVDMIGLPALAGTGIERLCYRDTRPVVALEEVGLHAHATPDVMHVGDPNVTVSQGNHTVNGRNAEQLPLSERIEVLHLPWRSWEQYRHKVENAGRAYETRTDGVRPSPNHHGMRDYWRLRRGTLMGHYVSRHPTEAELAVGASLGWYELDNRLSALAQFGNPDVELDEAAAEEARVAAAPELAQFRMARTQTRIDRLAVAQAEMDTLHEALEELRTELAAMRRRRVVRAADMLYRRRR